MNECTFSHSTAKIRRILPGKSKVGILFEIIFLSLIIQNPAYPKGPETTSRRATKPSSKPAQNSSTIKQNTEQIKTSPSLKSAQTSRAKGKKPWISAQLRGLLQSWLILSLDEREPYSKLGDSKISFRIRRARLYATVQISRLASAKIMIDPARVLEASERELSVKDSSGKELGTTKVKIPNKISFLIDAYLDLHLLPYFNISLGQAKIPVSLEGFGSASKLFLVERADVARKIGSKRDIGIWFKGKFSFLTYQIGLYNGSGMNRLDGDILKDLGIRLTATPIRQLFLGFSFYRTLGCLCDGGKMILGGDLQFSLGNFLLRGEVYWSQIGISQSEVKELFGTYLLAAYKFFLGKFPLELALRWEWFDSAFRKMGGDTWRLAGGMNLYLIGNHLKFQLDYVHSQSQSLDSKQKLVSTPGDAIFLTGQVAF